MVMHQYQYQYQFSGSVVSDYLWPHELKQAWLPYSSSTPGVYSNSCPLSWWCHITISSSVVPFSFHLQSFPASGSFQISQFFALGGQSIGFQLQHQSFQWIFRTDFLQDGLVESPCNPRDCQEPSPIPHFKGINSSVLSFLYRPTHIHIWLLEKTIALTRWIFVGKVMSLFWICCLGWS